MTEDTIKKICYTKAEVDLHPERTERTAHTKRKNQLAVKSISVTGFID